MNRPARLTRISRFLLALLVVGIAAIASLGEEASSLLTTLEAELIPAYGAGTTYGIQLDLRNTAQFIDWYHGIELTDEETSVKDRALSALVAPCCDDNSAATCCCPCNLSRSVWGLSAYLIQEKGYGVEEIREAASEWLRFSRPDYYLAAALEDRGIEPLEFGISTAGSCYQGRCDFPVTDGGCAGMTDLVMPDLATLPVVAPAAENKRFLEADLASMAFGLVSPIEATAVLGEHAGEETFVVLDVRTPEEFAGGHLADAVNLDYFSDDFESALGDLDKDETYLMYCQSGGRSGNTATLMEGLGFCCVFEIDGGILAWAESGLPLVAD